MARRVLIAEFLLAESAALQQASASLREEALAMLTTVASDFAAIPDVTPVVLVSSEMRAEVVRRVAGSCEVHEVDAAGLVSKLRSLEARVNGYAASLLIAPESGGVLASLLELLQSGDWRHVRSLNVPARVAALFADKLATANWLDQNGLRTPPTFSVSSDRAGLLARELQDMTDWLVSTNHQQTVEGATSTHQVCVLKPRDGAGSDRVQLVRIEPGAMTVLSALSHADDPWVLQPFMSGTPCSIGVLGGGVDAKPVVLLPARQKISGEGGGLKWVGGEIPLTHPHNNLLTAAANSISSAIGPFAGYLGIDAILAADDAGLPTVVIVEVNPRLCTSYVGYRQMAAFNLAARMLEPGAAACDWKPQRVRFSGNGDVVVSGES